MNVRTKAIAGIIGVFVVGGLFGAIGAGLYVQSQVDEARALRDQDGFRRHFTEQLELSTAQLADFEAALLSYMNSEHADLIKQINDTGDYNDEIGAQFKTAIDKS